MPPQSPEDLRWFTQEVVPHESSLRAYLQAAAPATADVEDLLQDSYLRLLRVRQAGGVRCVQALLFVIARNAVRDAVRHKLSNREVSGTEIETFPAPDPASDVIDLVTRRQEQMLLAEAMAALPERCREVLILRKIHGLSQREIAQKLGIAESTVESLVSRGLRRCALYLRPRLRGKHSP